MVYCILFEYSTWQSANLLLQIEIVSGNMYLMPVK